LEEDLKEVENSLREDQVKASCTQKISILAALEVGKSKGVRERRRKKKKYYDFKASLASHLRIWLGFKLRLG